MCHLKNQQSGMKVLNLLMTYGSTVQRRSALEVARGFLKCVSVHNHGSIDQYYLLVNIRT